MTVVDPNLPDLTVSARAVFHIDTDLQVPAFSVVDEHVPPVDPGYIFERETTLALLAGFLHNRRVLVQGRHGTGKSSHVEQVAAQNGAGEADGECDGGAGVAYTPRLRRWRSVHRDVAAHGGDLG